MSPHEPRPKNWYFDKTCLKNDYFKVNLSLYKAHPDQNLDSDFWLFGAIFYKMKRSDAFVNLMAGFPFLSPFRKLIFCLTFQNTLIIPSFERSHSFCH